MSYYILPKKHMLFSLRPYIHTDNNVCERPYLSHSVYYYLNNIDTELSHCDFTDINVELLQKQINPYEYLLDGEFVNLKKKTFTYFIYIELLKISNVLFDTYASDKSKGVSIFCDIELIEIMSSIMYINKYHKLHFNQSLTENIDIMSFLNTKIDNIYEYTKDLLKVLSNILLFQSNNGSCIIKIGEVRYKPTIDILYILSILYNKVYIIKPNTSNGFSSERYVVCKNLSTTQMERNILSIYINTYSLNWVNNKYNNNSSIFSNEIPYYFINKIEESNLGIAHQFLEYNNILINAIYSKLCKEKMDSIKKININKCILWCDKYKIPYKTNDKNIFLHKIEINQSLP